jgi:rare lipoprotein A
VRHPAEALLRGLVAALALAALAGCGHAPVRPGAQSPGQAPRHDVDVSGREAPSATRASDPCAPTRVHRDSDYTPGGLYLPGVSDGGPVAAIDVSALPEPVPRREPRARTGNRSPYTVLGKVYRVRESASGYHERGIASWYGTKFNGRATSSGELYDICSFTAAHKTLPLPSFVRVTNLDNGRSLMVRVNDRGPFHDGRVMDLSYAAAVRLGVDRTGTARVELQAIDVDGDDAPPPARARATASSPGLPVGAALPSMPTRVDAPLSDPPATEPPLGGAVLQVASFGGEANARGLAQRLSDAGFAGVDLEQADAGGRRVWRVRIGPLPAAQVGAVLDRLRGMGLPDARVLRQAPGG